MSKKEVVKRYGLFVIGVFFMGLGVAFTKYGELGVSPISSVANVLSLKFTSVSMGTWLTFTNCMLIIAQILILRRRFQPIQLLQVPLSFVFGWFTDLCMWMISPIPNDTYPVKLGCVLAGVLILGFGVALTFLADVVMNSGEALVKAIADTLRKDFGIVKVIFDISYVLLSIVISMILFQGAVMGTREGTIIAAVFTGLCAKWYIRRIKAPIERILTQ